MILIHAGVFCVLVAAAAASTANVWLPESFPNPATPAGSELCGLGGKPGFLCDPDRLLSEDERQQLNGLLFKLEDAFEIAGCGGVQLGVAVLQKMHADTSAESFSRALRGIWKVGHMPVRAR